MKQIFEFSPDEMAQGMFKYVETNLKPGHYKPTFNVVKNANSVYGVSMQLIVEEVDGDEPTDL